MPLLNFSQPEVPLLVYSSQLRNGNCGLVQLLFEQHYCVQITGAPKVHNRHLVYFK